jgi:DNA (cytosine-5)-methyltransferase 1
MHRRPRALDLFCGAGGMSTGLERAGFDVTAVDNRPMPHHRGGRFIQSDAMTFPLDGYDFIHASPPCQAFTPLRHLHPERAYPDLVDPIRQRLIAAGVPYSIENVPGAPLGNPESYLILLCGTMFGLTTPDGRAELRRHRLFETSFFIFPHPVCRHGGAQSLSVCGSGLDSNKVQWARRSKVLCVAGGKAMSGGMREPQGMARRRALSVVGHVAEISPTNWGRHKDRRAISITGATPQTNVVRNQVRETFSVEDARAAMGIDWPMPMKYLSQAIPPAYGSFIGDHAMAEVLHRRATA